MSSHFIDIGHMSLNKHGEELCGDQVFLTETDDRTVIMVLADGLGSGVKACILSTLTAKIIATMISQSMSIEDCVSTIAATLPVCEERGIAYSTFTIIKMSPGLHTEIIQYDNPLVIVLRNGKNLELPLDVMEIEGKYIYRSKLKAKKNDMFVSISDGVEHAGVGKTLNLGWRRDNIITFLEKRKADRMAAKAVTTVLLEECKRLYQSEPGDDTTVCTIKVRSREPVGLLIGPAQDPADDTRMMRRFFGRPGKHIVCGGTSAGIAARHLGRELLAECDYPDPEIPPIGRIKGVDLVTEGVITISRVLDYARDHLKNNSRYYEWCFQKDGASRIARMLFEEATDIDFFVGRAINPAHQNPDLPINFSIKMRLVDELAACLKKMGKDITVSHY
ncbi:serine/threonine-protein phosphatase [Desulfovibrio sp. OttesenSCG-928-M14]|nr:serine/threonine-protein phosphatase [Desulfovibrio sp. OttesenSCG-928-M14]